MRKVNQSISTDGSSLWSEVAREVKILGIDVPYINDEGDFGELHVIFDTATWDVAKDGLIYTDKQFLKELKDLLTNMGLPGDDVNYSEQGMQGTKFVSLDIGEKFINAWRVRTLESML